MVDSDMKVDTDYVRFSERLFGGKIKYSSLTEDSGLPEFLMSERPWGNSFGD